MYDTQTQIAIIIEWFYGLIFKDILDFGPNMRALLLMNPCEASYGSTENPFFTFWSSTGSNIQALLSGIALTMCGIFFCVEFVKTFSRIEGTTYEAVIGVGLKLCFAKLAISLGGKLMEAFTATGHSIITNISTAANSQKVDWATQLKFSVYISKSAMSLGIADGFAVIAISLIPLLVVKVSFLIVTIMAYGRLLELMLYHAFMPLPMGMIFLDNARIPKRFFASYFATILQGVFMFVGYSVFLTKVIPIMQDVSEATATLSGLTSKLFQVVLWCVMMIVIVMKSGSWASKVVGEG